MDKNLLRKAGHFAKQGKLGQARGLCQKLLAREPDNVQALYLSGSICLLEKDYEAGGTLLKQALVLNPNHPDALNNLGLFYLEHDRDMKTAERCFTNVIEQNSTHISALTNLGNLYLTLHQIDSAEVFYHKALALNPNDGRLLNNIGSICNRRDKRDEAIEYFRRALEFLPEDSDILSNLIISVGIVGDKEEVLKLIAQIMKLRYPGAALFPVYAFTKRFCLWEEAKKVLSGALKIIHDGRATLSSFESLNLHLLATSDVSSETLFDTHRMAGNTIDALRLRPPYTGHETSMHMGGRLRVGYLSPDFRDHVVSTFFRGLINYHDRARFQVYCYSNTQVEDEITQQYRDTADVFVNVTGLSDSQLAERIHADGIHFLVDLAGHTRHSRVYVMSYRPAPVQIMYLGYPYTSGLTSVDYFISDPYLDGPRNASFFTEKQLRLPESFITFDSLKEQEINPRVPWERNGFITFGSLNNTYKLNPVVIRVWSQVLKRVPDAKMMINHPHCDLDITRIKILKEFAKNGIDEHRIEIVWGRHPEGSYLRYYNDIDIVLDTFPLTGGTTTIDAVWMGVPVVTLVGDIYPHRLSYSVLKNIGIDVEDLIAFTEEDYVQKAVALANNPARIVELHRAIPESLKRSILCDPIRLTRQMEAAYRDAWNRKFPDHPISAKMEDAAVHYVPVRGGVEIAVAGSLDDLDTYVLQEQHGWFDPEYEFVRGIIQPGMRMVDIGAGTGIYAIPLAQRIGHGGKLWATTNTYRDAGFLLKSKERNHLKNLDVLVRGDRKLQLDVEMATHGLVGIDFVRMNTNATDAGLLEDGVRFFSENSPLVMFGIKRDQCVVDSSLVSLFKKIGYDSYRLIPGLNLLVPFTSEADLDAFAMNLFGCKADQADVLAQRGLLVCQTRSVSELPGIHINNWQDYLGSLPYASDLMENWMNAPAHHEDWEVYWVALNLFARAKGDIRQAEDRYACLQASYNILLLLLNAKPNFPRLLSFCRVLVEIGKREAAVNVLHQICRLFESGVGTDLDEPFLALSDEFASVHPGAQLAEWVFASVLEQRETLRAFSSFFAGQDSLGVLEAIKKTGFHGLEVERRLALIKTRYHIESEERLVPFHLTEVDGSSA